MRVELADDHLRIHLTALESVQATRGGFVIPYSTIQVADVVRTEIPGLFEHFRLGVHLPGVVARGVFITWKGARRFLWLDRSKPWALRLRLVAHPQFADVVLALPDPEGTLHEIDKRRIGRTRPR